MSQIYLIDVDDVLLNTPALKDRLKDVAEERGESDLSLQRPELLLALHDADPAFLPSLVYAGGREFIEKCDGDCFLVSTAQSSKSEREATETELAFQKLKIQLCGLETWVGEKNVRVVRGYKDEALQEFADRHALFIDNDITHLKAAHNLGIEVVHMVREHLQKKGGIESPHVGAHEYSEATFRVGSFKELMQRLDKEND